MKINGIMSNISFYGNTFKRKRIHCKIVNNYENISVMEYLWCVYLYQLSFNCVYGAN